MRLAAPAIRRSFGFVCLLAMVTLSACSQSPAGWTEDAIAQIDTVLEEAARANGGCALVVLVGGEVVYENGFHGLTPDSVIPIVSASKWLAGATLMTLVDDGLLSLDDSVSALFPALSEELVLVRHLFSHTSGLPGNINACTSWMTLGDCAAAIAGLRIATMPGKVFEYGELSMQIGGHLAELATGMSWHDLFAERLAGPLGMQSTDYRTFGETANPVVGGGAQSSALDYVRFVQMLLDSGTYEGERVLSEEAVTEILTDQLVDTPIRPETGYGLGCWGYRVDPGTHRLLLASSPGAYGFIPWIDVARNLAGVLAANSSYDAVDPYWNRILAILDQAFPIP